MVTQQRVKYYFPTYRHDDLYDLSFLPTQITVYCKHAVSVKPHYSVLAPKINNVYYRDAVCIHRSQMVEKGVANMIKITLVMVMTLNQKTTRGNSNNIYEWTSFEDQEYFNKLKHRYTVIFMGSKTYESIRDLISLSPRVLRVVFTRNPSRYAKQVIPGQLEFTNQKPKTVVSAIESRGYENALLVGGSKINSSFLRDNLVSELSITIEPKIFKEGKGLFSRIANDVNLELINVSKLNKQGTLLCRYQII